MASFFDMNIETPQEAQERLRQEMLGRMQGAQRRDPLEGLGFQLAELANQGRQKFGGYVPPDVQIAQDTESAIQGGVAAYEQSVANGKDPLEAQRDEFLRAAKALRSINPAASRQMMQKYVEAHQALEEQSYNRGRLKASDTRAEEAHEANLNSDVSGLTVKIERIDGLLANPKMTPETKSTLEKRKKEAMLERDRMLKKDPNYQQVELEDGIWWVNKTNPNDRIRIGDAYHAPVNGPKGAGTPRGERDYEAAKQDAENVDSSIDEALRLADEFGTTGAVGQVIGKVGGTDAYAMRRAIDTIIANVGFDRLQRMRDESKTGGALGQIAVRELELLQQTIASLDPNLDAKTLKTNLKRVKDQYAKAMEKYDAAMREKEAMASGKPAPTEEAPAAPSGGRTRGGGPAPASGRGTTQSGVTYTVED